MADELHIRPVPSRVAAMAYANEMGAQSLLLVVGAANRRAWCEVVAEHWRRSETLPIIYPILREADGVHPHADCTIVSYALCKSMAIKSALSRRRYGLLVLDDADHHIRNPNCLRTWSILGREGIITLTSHLAYVKHDEVEAVSSLEDMIATSRAREWAAQESKKATRERYDERDVQ